MNQYTTNPNTAPNNPIPVNIKEPGSQINIFIISLTLRVLIVETRLLIG